MSGVIARKWEKDHHIMEITKLSRNQYSLKCELDIQDDEALYSGRLEAAFEYDFSFIKFVVYNVQLTVLNNECCFSSK